MVAPYVQVDHAHFGGVLRRRRLLAPLFLITVATIDLPNLPKNAHERLFWTLTLRKQPLPRERWYWWAANGRTAQRGARR